MGLDKDDTIVKRRMAQKMQFIAEDVAAARAPTSAELRAWFEQNTDKFQEPPRVSFRHLYFAPDKRGTRVKDDAVNALAKLAGQPEDAKLAATLADPFMFQEYYRDRAPDYLGKEFGPVFALAVAKLPPGSWQGPIESGFGWHLVYVDTRVPGRLPSFEEIEGNVKTAWLSEQRQRLGKRRTRACGRSTRCCYPRRPTHRRPRALPRRRAGRKSRLHRARAGNDEAGDALPSRASARYRTHAPRYASFAHEARPAYLEMKETAPGQFSVLWRIPVLAGMRLPLVLQMPEGVRNVKPPAVEELADSLVERRWVDAGPNGLAGKRIEIAGLQMYDHRRLGPGRIAGRQDNADDRAPFAAVGRGRRHAIPLGGGGHVRRRRHPPHPVRRGSSAVRARPAADGRNGWMLVKTLHRVHRRPQHDARHRYAWIRECAGTAAQCRHRLEHTFLGPEIVRVWRGETSFTIRHPWVVAFAFGLLHGFGFATAMTSAGLPRQELPWALFSFNVGVELGQLGFVALVLAMWRSFRVLEVRWPPWVQALPGYTVGTLGAFWTIQRVALLIGALR